MPLEFEDTITSDVGRRLEELFEQNEERQTRSEYAQRVRELESMFSRLSRIVDTVDDELTDYLLGKLRDCVSGLQDQLRDDKALFMFVRLINSIAEFVATNGLRKNPGALKLLKDAAERCRKAAFSPDLTDTEKKRILYTGIMRYKKLKEAVARRDEQGKDAGETVEADSVGDAQPPPTGEAEEAEAHREEPLDPAQARDDVAENPDMARMAPHEAFVFALEEIKKTLRAEFSALRTELSLWRKGQ